jgi:hypothetical protein
MRSEEAMSRGGAAALRGQRRREDLEGPVRALGLLEASRQAWARDEAEKIEQAKRGIVELARDVLGFVDFENEPFVLDAYLRGGEW